MNFKANVLSATVVAATLATATLAVSPAHAAVLNGTLNLTSIATGGAIFSPTSINFFGPGPFGIGAGSGTVTNGASSGSFTSLGVGLIKDLTVPSPTSTQKNNFLSLIDLGLGSVTFTLNNFIYNASSRSAVFDGFFSNNGDTTFGSGQFTAQSLGSPTSTYSLSITTATRAVPTPALLPGLIALGVGVLRKRKAEATEKAGVDA